MGILRRILTGLFHKSLSLREGFRAIIESAYGDSGLGSRVVAVGPQSHSLLTLPHSHSRAGITGQQQGQPPHLERRRLLREPESKGINPEHTRRSQREPCAQNHPSEGWEESADNGSHIMSSREHESSS